MTFRMRGLIFGALCLIVSARGAVAAGEGQMPTATKLANGMDVVVIEDHRAPVVTQMVWYRIGSADEAPGKSGIAHFLEHLMFKGTPSIPPGEFSKTVARQGGQDNAFTSYDVTAYWERFAADRLDFMMGLEADRMRNLRLTDAIVLPERDVIIEERRMRTDNDPSALLGEQVYAALYLNHPYGHPVIGWLHEMQQLTRGDAEAWYRQHYAPNNAILIVAGDVTPAAARALAEKHFGKLEPQKQAARVRPKEPPAIAERRIVLTDPRATQAYVMREYLSPSYGNAKGREAHALSLTADILGGGATSRLYRALVEEQKMASEASASFDGDYLDDASISISLTPATGVSLDRLEKAADKVIAAFLKSGPTAAELKRSQQRMRAAAIYARDSQESMANIYGYGLATGQSLESIYRWPETIEEVTADEVKAAANAYLTPERSVTGWLETVKP